LTYIDIVSSDSIAELGLGPIAEAGCLHSGSGDSGEKIDEDI
jgi:hypothetical protein